MALDLNTNPYYDDFDEFKNYHQILFRPGAAVQARELTQIQSILKNQIEKFGDHIFKQGSVVIPGNSFADLSFEYVRLENTFGGVTVQTQLFEGVTIVGATSGVKANVRLIAPKTSTDDLTFYINYISGGVISNTPNGKSKFDQGEELYIESQILNRVQVRNIVDYKGVGAAAFVNEGVYYVNGTFVSVESQSTILSKYTNTPSCHVLFKIKEEIVDANNDLSLLDPSQGTNNFAAPGADRMKISLELTTLPIGAIITNDYFEIMRYKEGVLLEHSRYPKYNELEKSLARRTFDQAGDYIVNGYNTKVLENKLIGSNSGYDVNGDSAKLTYLVSSGKAYVKGFEVDNLAERAITVDKTRTAASTKIDSITSRTSYGQYFLISGLTGQLNIQNRETVTLWAGTPGGSTNLGTAVIFALDYYDGDGAANPIYKAYFYNLNIGVNKFENVAFASTASFSAKVVTENLLLTAQGTFDFDSSPELVTVGSLREGTVAFWNQSENKIYIHKSNAAKPLPIVGDTITGASTSANATIQKRVSIVSDGQSGAVFRLPRSATKTLRNASNNFDLQYTTVRLLTISAGQTTTATVTGTIVPIEAGTFIATDASGILPRAQFSLNISGNQIIRNTPAGTTISIYCQVVATNGTPRTKSLATATNVVKASALSITLNHVDVFNITSVIDASGNERRNDYTLDRNINEYSYETSKIVLKRGVTAPVGNVTISYEYFSHTPGDFFSVDSYVGLGADYLDQIPGYKSPNGEFYDLRDCLDFRASAGTNTNMLVSGSVVSSTVQRFMPRIDSVCITETGNIEIIQGIPSDSPVHPMVPSSYFEIERFFIPAYVSRIYEIRSVRVGANRYTMNDIRGIDNRITDIENFSVMTADESYLTTIEVLDPISGLNRFKTGYLIENIENPLIIADWGSEEYVASFDDGIYPGIEEVHFSMKMASNSSGYKYRNGYVTLPYTEVVFAEVSVSSKIVNLNPYLVFSWEGTMSLIPSRIEWTERIDNPDIIVNVEELIKVFVDIWIDPPARAPAPAAQFVVGPSGANDPPAAPSPPALWWNASPVGPIPQWRFFENPNWTPEAVIDATRRSLQQARDLPGDRTDLINSIEQTLARLTG